MFHDHFSQVAARYADSRPHYPQALFDFLGTLGPPDGLVWDCACGSGQATVDLASRFHRVIATDASREQIAAAPPTPNVEFLVASAEDCGLPARSVDLVTVAQALHWFDFDRFHTEVKRVLKPGGVIAAWAYGLNEVDDPSANRLVHDFYSHVVGPYWPPERRLVEEGYRTIPFPFIELETPSLRMEARWTLEQLLGYFGTWSATSRYRAATGTDPLPRLRDALSAVWGDSDHPRLVTWPLSLRAGRR